MAKLFEKIYYGALKNYKVLYEIYRNLPGRGDGNRGGGDNAGDGAGDDGNRGGHGNRGGGDNAGDGAGDDGNRGGHGNRGGGDNAGDGAGDDGNNAGDAITTAESRQVESTTSKIGCRTALSEFIGGADGSPIKDRASTDTYINAIFHHKDRIEGKVVLVVGFGTGILSIFRAQVAGARQVYVVVDARTIGIDQINEVINENNLSGKVFVLHGEVEDLEIDKPVDVIVSEWMGCMLLYESMLGSVITARDKWLKPGGLILPSYATLYMAPVSYPQRYSVDFWRSVREIDSDLLESAAKRSAFGMPLVEMIKGENVLTRPHVVKHIDCLTIEIDEIETLTSNFKFKSMKRAPFHGFGFWFDVEFESPSIHSSLGAAPDDTVTETSKRKKPVNPSLVLSTAPEDPPTRWQQTLVYFNPLLVEQGQVIEGFVKLTQSRENARFMNIHLAYLCAGQSYVKEAVMR